MNSPIPKIILILVASIFTAACAHSPKSETSAESKPTTLVLIQGVHLDGASWDEVKKYLTPGQAVMDLGRVGRDTKTPATTGSIAQSACEMIPDQSILVAHSYGGAIANDMFGYCPTKITKIIYVAAVAPITGEKPFDVLSADNQKTYARAVKFKKPKIVPNSAKQFFSVTDHEVTANATYPKLYSEWMSVTSDEIKYDVASFEHLPKAYVFTTKDPVITPETQHRYADRLKITQIASLAVGHFPMISDPKRLAEAITKLTK